MFKIYDRVMLLEEINKEKEIIPRYTEGIILDVYDKGNAYGVQFIKEILVNEPYLIVNKEKIILKKVDIKQG